MQGDSCFLGIRLLNNAGNPITPGDILEVEITIGGLRKTYTGAQLQHRDGLWLFPLTQQETFSLPPMTQQAQVRLVWANGAVEGAPLYGVRILESISKEVL